MNSGRTTTNFPTSDNLMSKSLWVLDLCIMIGTLIWEYIELLKVELWCTRECTSPQLEILSTIALQSSYRCVVGLFISLFVCLLPTILSSGLGISLLSIYHFFFFLPSFLECTAWSHRSILTMLRSNVRHSNTSEKIATFTT